MTADEMKNIALEAGKAEYENAITRLREAAGKGQFSVKFSPRLSDAAIHLLEKGGYETQTSDYATARSATHTTVSTK